MRHPHRGTTCYLNSLVQLLYMTPELRDRIYALSDDDLGTPENPTEIPEVKQDFSGALAEMGFDKVALVGVEGDGSRCGGEGGCSRWST